MRFLFSLVLILSCQIGLAQTCQYLAYEGCMYPTGTPIDAQFGGTGWSSPWQVQNGNTQQPGYAATGTSSLSYSNLQTLGNYFSGGQLYLSIGRPLNLSSSGPFAPYLTPSNRIGAPGTTLYWSVLLRKEQNNNQTIAAMLQGGNTTPWVTNQNPRVVLGYFGTASELNGVRYWSLGINNSTYLTNVPVIVGTTQLLVMRIDFGASSSMVHCWVNPINIGGSEPPAALQITVNNTIELSAFAAYLGNDPNQGSLDEIRVGSSYACVTPDPLTPLNIPPQANLNANSTQGITPFTVQFDASTSYDPDGTIVSYRWNFMDGSAPDTTVSPVNSHVFHFLGNHLVNVTVVDNEGLEHTAYRSILVTNSQGNYPCLTSLRSLQLATCQSASGSFLVMPPANASIELRDAAQALIPMSSTPGVFQNLAAGTYTLAVSDATGCRDTLYPVIAIDSSTCSGWAPQACLNFGMNLDYVNYYDRQRMFKNLFRDASDWITYNVNSPTPWSPWNTGRYAEIPMDSNGYPLQVPFSTSIGMQGVRASLSANGHMASGTYTLWYDGQGVVELNGVVVNQQQNGRIDFTVPVGAGNIWLNISFSQAGDPIRNIRILRPGDENTWHSDPFYSGFTNKIRPFSTIRFMEALATNLNEFQPSEWNERSDPAYYTQGGYRGISYETIIDLCNRMQCNAWINIPHRASDDYIQRMANLFRERLDPTLTIYLEYSNEVWNWMFPQANFVSNTGPQHIAYPRRYAERCRHAFEIWSQVFGAESGRLKRVLNTQYGNSFYTEQILAHLPQDSYDYLSPSWYFGYSGSACAQNFSAATTPEDIIECTRQTFLASFPALRQEYRNAGLYGKKVVHYEGGQHMADIGQITPYLPALWNAQLHPNMYALYNEVIDSLRRLKPDLSCAYNLVRINETQFGSFGHLTDIDETPTLATAPKWMALMDSRCETPSLLAIQMRVEGFAQGPYQQAVWYQQGMTGDAGSPRCDIVDIVLHETQRPFSVLDSFTSFLHRDGTCRLALPPSYRGDSVWIEIRHRNALTIWTAAPVYIGDTVTLDLRNSAAVFGGNIVLDAAGFGALASGDINQDGVVDGLDYNDWEMDNNNFGSGYLSTDLNGDGIVDGLDFLLWEVNNNQFAGIQQP